MSPSQHQPESESRRLPDPTEAVFDQGLQFDLDQLNPDQVDLDQLNPGQVDPGQLDPGDGLLGTVYTRRRALGVAGVGAAAALLAACGSSGEGARSATTAGTSTSESASNSATTAAMDAAATTAVTTAAGATTAATAAGECAVIPEETAGPYPGDGSNGPDVLVESGIVRSDITTSFGALTGTAEGVPFQITLQLFDADNGCAALDGAAVYLWHCDRDGNYSLYSEGVTDQNYLRGVQQADAKGTVTFTSIFPACYPGRWPHIHFEVYPSSADATDVANKIATSQIAIPEATCAEVYGSVDGYASSQTNLSQLSLATDNVFGDDAAAQQLGTISGSIDNDLAVTMVVNVSKTTQAVSDGAGTPPTGGNRPAGTPPGPPPSG